MFMNCSIFNSGLGNSFGQITGEFDTLLYHPSNINQQMWRDDQASRQAQYVPPKIDIDTQICINHLQKNGYFISTLPPESQKEEIKSNGDIIQSRPLFGKGRGYNLRGNSHLLDIK